MKGTTEDGPCWPPLNHPASPPGPQGCFPIRMFLQFIQICGNIIIPTKLTWVPFCHLPDTSYPLPSLAGWLESWGSQSTQASKAWQPGASVSTSYIPWGMQPEVSLCSSHIPVGIPGAWRAIFSSIVKHLLQGRTLLISFFFSFSFLFFTRMLQNVTLIMEIRFLFPSPLSLSLSHTHRVWKDNCFKLFNVFVQVKLPAPPDPQKNRPKSQYWAFVADLMVIPFLSLEVTWKLLSVRQKWGMQEFYSIEYMAWESEFWHSENRVFTQVHSSGKTFPLQPKQTTNKPVTHAIESNA